MSSTATSRTLLSRVRDPDDDAAWREFDRRYGELILRYCIRCGLQLFDAEDLRQIVMLRLARVLPAYQHDPARGRFRAFLGCLVRNEISRHYARPMPRSQWVDMAEISAAAVSDADDVWEQEWTRHHLRRALAAVRQEHDERTVEVFNRLLTGQTVERVARELSLTRDAVHKIKQRLRDRLRATIAKQVRLEDAGDG